jgi:hypothetical protein
LQSICDVLPSLSVVITPGHAVHARPALEEYMPRGQGSHCILFLSRVPLAHVHERLPTEPPGDVDPAPLIMC